MLHEAYEPYGGPNVSVEIRTTLEFLEDAGFSMYDLQGSSVILQYESIEVTLSLHSYAIGTTYGPSGTVTLSFKQVHDLFAGKKKTMPKPPPSEGPHIQPFTYFANVLDSEGYAALEKLCAKKGITFIWKDGGYTLLAVDKTAGHSVTKVEVLPDGFLYVCGHSDVAGANGAHDAQLNAIKLEAMVEMIEAYEPVKADMSALETHGKNVFSHKAATIGADNLAAGEITLSKLLGEDTVNKATYDFSAVKAMGDILADAIAKQADPEFSLPPFTFTKDGQLSNSGYKPIEDGAGTNYYKPTPLNVDAATTYMHSMLTSVGVIAGSAALQGLADYYHTGNTLSHKARHDLQKLQVSILYSLLKSMGLPQGYPDFVWLRANVYKLANAENSFGVRYVLRLKNQDLHLGAPHPEANARLLAVALLEKALHSHKGQVFYYTHGATAEEFTEAVLQAITLKLAGNAMEGTMPVKFTKDEVKAAVDAAQGTKLAAKGKTKSVLAAMDQAGMQPVSYVKKTVGQIAAAQSDTAAEATSHGGATVALKDAVALGQPVHGTSKGSIYRMVAANDKDNVKLAAKYNGSELSLRLEGNLAKIIGRIKQCGLFVVKGNGEYASVHVSVGNPLQAEMLYASARSVIQANRHIDLAGLIQ